MWSRCVKFCCNLSGPLIIWVFIVSLDHPMNILKVESSNTFPTVGFLLIQSLLFVLQFLQQRPRSAMALPRTSTQGRIIFGSTIIMSLRLGRLCIITRLVLRDSLFGSVRHWTDQKMLRQMLGSFISPLISGIMSQIFALIEFARRYL